ncbi:autophagy-related protein 27 [Parachaetomium inaequale]|uniref:Autophagy-related protein 27 n=1 Tax=Parachaetomium inaequale TaxID=2588326 RepID=A0AAN6PL09_9PEZI|nr:autophagy-related protein 27 [Parachaetomium inaequale]
MKTPSTWRRWPSALETATLLLSLTPIATATATAAPSTIGTMSSSPLACDAVPVDGGHTYNLRALAGPHVAVTHEYTRPTWHNTTYAVDVCGVLKRKGEVPEGEGCPEGTRVCAIKHRWDPKAGKSAGIDQVIPIVVGDDKGITWEAKRLPGDDTTQKDGKKEGLRLTLQGGTTYQQRAQRTVVEFRCNPDLEGTEGEWESVDEYVPGDKKNARREKKDDDKKDDDKKDGKEDESTPEKQLKKDGAALVWEGYKREKDADGGDMDTLYLTWYTKHACDAAVDEPVAESKHWGVFTWVVILVFLATASYLIFGSWLNYNRYGARGLDLLPHGDTLRDVPYLLRDLVRRALNTLQSTGSRGGYSAV